MIKEQDAVPIDSAGLAARMFTTLRRADLYHSVVIKFLDMAVPSESLS